MDVAIVKKVKETTLKQMPKLNLCLVAKKVTKIRLF